MDVDADSPLVWAVAVVVGSVVVGAALGEPARGVVGGLFLAAAAFTFLRMSRM